MYFFPKYHSLGAARVKTKKMNLDTDWQQWLENSENPKLRREADQRRQRRQRRRRCWHLRNKTKLQTRNEAQFLKNIKVHNWNRQVFSKKASKRPKMGFVRNFRKKSVLTEKKIRNKRKPAFDPFQVFRFFGLEVDKKNDSIRFHRN